jgi:DNA-directed RNA polymerase specialized sigma24 family protein
MATEPAPLPPNDDFADLLARVRGGDDAATAELVQRYERAVLRSVRSRLSRSMRGAMDSMDVMQSVHRSLLTGVKNERFQLTTPQQLIGLAVVMVQRKVARHWRKLKRFPAGGHSAESGSLPPLEGIAGEEAAPVEIVTANELLERILSQLDDIDRQLVHLKLTGHSSVESAAILGREPAFVRMRWSRLRQLLRERGYPEG